MTNLSAEQDVIVPLLTTVSAAGMLSAQREPKAHIGKGITMLYLCSYTWQLGVSMDAVTETNLDELRQNAQQRGGT